jgi:hypothetical protein
VDIVRFYSDADGDSHFEGVQVDLAAFSVSGLQTASSELWPARAAQFRNVDDDFASDLHAAGRRQFGHQPVRVLSREPFTRLSARGLWLRRPVRAHELVRDPY